MFEQRGEKSQRTLVVELFAAAEYGATVTHGELASVLEGADVGTVRAAVNRAKRTLEVEHNKAVEAVRGVGYRVVEPSEQRRLALAHQRKSGRSLVRARSKVQHVDLSQLSEGERVAVTLAATALAAQIDFARRADLRYASKAKVDAFMSDQSQKAERTDAELDEVKARMERLERRLMGGPAAAAA